MTLHKSFFKTINEFFTLLHVTRLKRALPVLPTIERYGNYTLIQTMRRVSATSRTNGIQWRYSRLR